MVSRSYGLMVGASPRIVNSQAPSLAPVPSRLRRATLVRAYEHVARDRGGGDHVERIAPGGEGARRHRDADRLISLVQPAGRQAVTLGAEQQCDPLGGP